MYKSVRDVVPLRKFEGFVFRFGFAAPRRVEQQSALSISCHHDFPKALASYYEESCQTMAPGGGTIRMDVVLSDSFTFPATDSKTTMLRLWHRADETSDKNTQSPRVHGYERTRKRSRTCAHAHTRTLMQRRFCVDRSCSFCHLRCHLGPSCSQFPRSIEQQLPTIKPNQRQLQAPKHQLNLNST